MLEMYSNPWVGGWMGGRSVGQQYKKWTFVRHPGGENDVVDSQKETGVRRVLL